MPCGWVPLICKIKKTKWEEKRTIYRIFRKIHVLFSPKNELGSSSEEESESDSEDEV